MLLCQKVYYTEDECQEDEEDCLQIWETFSGKEWRTITPEILEENYDKLPFFSPEAYHCFLPAYLIYSLDNFRDNANLDRSLVWEFRGYNFIHNGKTESHIKWLINGYQNFSKEQLYIIYEFIDLIIQKEKFDDFSIEFRQGKRFRIDYIEATLKT